MNLMEEIQNNTGIEINEESAQMRKLNAEGRLKHLTADFLRFIEDCNYTPEYKSREGESSMHERWQRKPLTSEMKKELHVELIKALKQIAKESKKAFGGSSEEKEEKDDEEKDDTDGDSGFDL